MWFSNLKAWNNYTSWHTIKINHVTIHLENKTIVPVLTVANAQIVPMQKYLRANAITLSISNLPTLSWWSKNSETKLWLFFSSFFFFF